MCFSLNHVFISSGLVPIKGLTGTQNPSSVQPFIDKNILKKGYEKAVKEFLDEKRRRIQEEQTQRVPIIGPKLVPVRTMTLRSDRPPPVETTRATTAMSAKRNKRRKSQSHECTSMEPNTKNHLRKQMQMTTNSQGKSRLPVAESHSNPVKTMTLRSKSYLRHPPSLAEVTEAKPANQQCATRKSARIAGKAAK